MSEKSLRCGKSRVGRSVVPRTQRRQAGYALLLVLFLTATVLIFAAAAVPRILTQGRRQKEDELIWRGEQYERAIRLYFRKAGRFPTSPDDLSKGVNGIHFLRKPYKDPMNPNGEWRMIYVTPAGTLVGSVRYHSLAELTATQMRLTGAAPLGAATLPASGMFGGAPPSQGLGASSAGAPSTPGAPTGQSQQTPQGQQPPQGPQTQPSLSASGTGDQGPVIGGNIIGVASKVDKPSLKVYLGGKTYREWEFIWNPMAQAAIAVQPGATPNQPAPSSPFGQNPQNPVPNIPPLPIPPQVPQNPQ